MNENVCPICGNPTHDGDCQGDAAYNESRACMSILASTINDVPDYWPQFLTRRFRAFAKQATAELTRKGESLCCAHGNLLVAFRTLEDAARAVVRDYQETMRQHGLVQDTAGYTEVGVNKAKLDALAAALSKEDTA